MKNRLYLAASRLTGEKTRRASQIKQSLSNLSTGITVCFGDTDFRQLPGECVGRFSTSELQLDQTVGVLMLAESSLCKIKNVVGEMRVLSVRAADSMLPGDERTHIEKKFHQGVAIIDAIAEHASFDGHKLFDGSYFVNRRVTLFDNVYASIFLNFLDVRSNTLKQILSCEEIDQNKRDCCAVADMASEAQVAVNSSIHSDAVPCMHHSTTTLQEEGMLLSKVSLQSAASAKNAIAVMNSIQHQVEANMLLVQRQKNILLNHKLVTQTAQENKVASGMQWDDAEVLLGLAGHALMEFSTHSQVTVAGDMEPAAEHSKRCNTDMWN